jgi:hypothetical protein
MLIIAGDWQDVVYRLHNMLQYPHGVRYRLKSALKEGLDDGMRPAHVFEGGRRSVWVLGLGRDVFSFPLPVSDL